MKTLATLALAATFVVAGCSKKDKSDNTESSGTTAPTKAAPEEEPSGGAKVFDYPTPQAFNDDYRSVQGAKFMDKFGLDGKFQIAGPVGKVITEEAGNSSVWFMLADNKRVSLAFADDGKTVTEKGLKAGDAIKVLCDAGGADDNLIMLLRCELK